MNIKTIYEVSQEVERFLRVAKLAGERLVHENTLPAGQRAYSTKEVGALRRASLDLTRALAKMRRYS